MILVKSEREIEIMRKAGRIAGLALKAGGEAIRPGATTREVELAIRREIKAHGARPSFLGYRGFPASCCISVNDEVIHGIPGSRRLREGDIVSIDVGATFQGFVGDTAATFPVGRVSKQARRLIDVTRDCFYRGFDVIRKGARVSDISKAIGNCVDASGFSLVQDWMGHGVGRSIHEDPDIPNSWDGSRGPRLIPGMTICIEPMLNAGGEETVIQRDGWTVTTADGSLSAHYEHTILVTANEPELLTRV